MFLDKCRSPGAGNGICQRQRTKQLGGGPSGRTLSEDPKKFQVKRARSRYVHMRQISQRFLSLKATAHTTDQWPHGVIRQLIGQRRDGTKGALRSHAQPAAVTRWV